MAREVNASTWEREVEQSEQPVAVDFWQPGCGWCEKLGPVYSAVAKEYTGATLLSLNIRAEEGNIGLADKYGIIGTPTIKVFCSGRAIGEIVGFRDQEGLKAELDHLIHHGDDCVAQSTKIK